MRPDVLPALRTGRADFLACLAFFSRLPVRHEALPDFSRAGWTLPAVGLTLGGAAGLVTAAAAAAGLPPLLAAGLGVLALAGLTGALHEDALADFADGLGGDTPKTRLAIMRDPRVGTFGVLALVFSSLFRVVALAAILADGALAACLALAGAGALSRAAALAPPALLPPARADGLGAAAAAVPPASLAAASILGGVIAALLCGFVNPAGTLLGLAAAAAATLGVTALARRTLGGQTGDVAGTAVQAAEIVFLTSLATFA